MKHILTAWILVLGKVAFGQLISERVEPLPNEAETINTAVYSLGKRGLMVLNEPFNGKACSYTYYSETLQQEKVIRFEMDNHTTDLGVLADEDSTSFIFLRSSTANWIIKTFNTETQTLSGGIYPKLDPFFLPETCVWFKGKIVMKGLLHWRPRLMILDLKTEKQELIELSGIQPAGRIEYIGPDNSNRQISILFRDINTRKKGAANLAFLDENGKISGPFRLEKDSTYFIIDAHIKWLNDYAFVVSGTYSRKHSTDQELEEASGFFFSKWENYEQQFMTYHSFSNFNAYEKYVAQNKLQDVERKKRRPGATDYISNRVVFHPAYQVDSGYRLIGEVYYPKYEYGYRIVRDIWGNVKNRIWENQFVGYEYTHMVIIDLDEQGNKINDYCNAIKLGYRPLEVIGRRMVVVNDPAGDLKIMYQNWSGLTICEIVDNEVQTTVLSGISAGVGATGYAPGRYYSTYWYGNHYIVYGYRTVKVKDGLLRESPEIIQSIFFVKKMTYPD